LSGIVRFIATNRLVQVGQIIAPMRVMHRAQRLLQLPLDDLVALTLSCRQ
jgi:hypothetical protein